MDVLTLLRSKNRYLQRFEQASARFLSETAEGLPHARFMESLGRLETTRGRILKALELFNRQLLRCIEALPDRSEEFLSGARKETEEADRLVERLLELDRAISDRIRGCQDRITLELAASEKSKKIISQFKSSWASGAGEELDRTL